MRFTRSEKTAALESLLRIGATAGELMANDRHPVLRGVVDQQGKRALAGCRRALRLGRPGVAHAWRTGLRRQSAALQRERATHAGPAKQQADIALKVRGTPELVELQQFDIVQPRRPAGRDGRGDSETAAGVGRSMREGRTSIPVRSRVEWPGSLRFPAGHAGQDDRAWAGRDVASSASCADGYVVATFPGDADMTLTGAFCPRVRSR